MNDKTLSFWKRQAVKRQQKMIRKARGARRRQTFIVRRNDFLALEKHIGRRLAAQLKVEELPDMTDCTAGDWGGIPNM